MVNKTLNNLTTWLTRNFGRPQATVLAIWLVLMWVIGLPFFGLSDTYQLVINTTTTVITFVMVFFVLNTQNRDSKGIHFKLDLILMKLGIDDLQELKIEDLPDKEIEKKLAEIVGNRKRK